MSKKDDILINILTRTSNRPLGFRKCYSSIKEQTYKNIRHIVSYDNDEDLWYLRDLNIILVDVTKLKSQEGRSECNPKRLNAPYNLYCNAMMDIVDEGWILFLDDDDNLYHNKVVEEIVFQIQKNQNENYIYIWQMRFPDGKVLPGNDQMDKHIIKKYTIGAPCFLFHSQFKNNARWDSFKVSDYRFLLQLLDIIPNKVFIRKIMIQINNFGDLGQRNDLRLKSSSNFEMPKSFYKNSTWYFYPKYHKKLFGILIFHVDTYNRFLNNILIRLGKPFMGFKILK